MICQDTSSLGGFPPNHQLNMLLNHTARHVAFPGFHFFFWTCFCFFCFFFKDFIYLSMRHTERERDRDTGRGRSRLPAGGPMWDSILGFQGYGLG